MPWIAPEIDPVAQPHIAGEFEMLTGWLEANRAALLNRCTGLTAEQLTQWAAPPSNLSLAGLVRHATDMEHIWFCARLRGEPVRRLYPGTDECFERAEPDTAERDVARLTEQWAASRAALDHVSLDDTFEWEGVGTMSVRWLLQHVICEYARHNGHADLLRERIDGRTGAWLDAGSPALPRR